MGDDKQQRPQKKRKIDLIESTAEELKKSNGIQQKMSESFIEIETITHYYKNLDKE